MKHSHMSDTFISSKLSALNKIKTNVFFQTLDMKFDSNENQKFRMAVLQTQLQTIGEKFHNTAEKWLATIYGLKNKVSAETQKVKTHPNQLMADLRKLNYERAYIDFKIQSMKTKRNLPKPVELRRKLKKTELGIEFQKEFPQQYQQFVQQLYKKLSQKRYKPDTKPWKSKILPDLNWNLSLEASPRASKKSKSRKTVTPNVNTIMNAIHGHGAKQFQDENGYYNFPTFTKAKIEKLLNIYIPAQTFQHLKKKMNEKQHKRKAKNIKLANLRKIERKNKFDILRNTQ